MSIPVADNRFSPDPSVAPVYALSAPAVYDGRFSAHPEVIPVYVENMAPGVFNVLGYGAKGDGSTDDTTAIQAAITACVSAGGGTVYLPAGIYRTSAALTIAGSNVTLLGAGQPAGNTNAPRLAATIIKPLTGMTGDVIQTALPPTPGNAGFIQYGVAILNMALDCSAMLGNVAGVGNGIHFYGVRYGLIANVDVFTCPNWAILCEGDATNFAFNTNLMNCRLGGNNAGVRFVFSEQCNLYRVIVESCNTATTAAQPYGSGQGTSAFHFWAGSGWTTAKFCTFGNGGSFTAEAVHLDNGGVCIVDSCLFDSVHGQAINSFGGNSIIRDNILSSPCTTQAVPAIQLGGSGRHLVSGNVFTGAGLWTFCVLESGTPAGDIITDNQLLVGSSGFISLHAASTAHVAHNGGYNPVGHAMSQPAVPASTTPQNNVFGVDAMVLVTGGTVSNVAIGGTNTGLTSGWFRVPGGSSITLTYTVAPTWSWYGD